MTDTEDEAPVAPEPKPNRLTPAETTKAVRFLWTAFSIAWLITMLGFGSSALTVGASVGMLLCFAYLVIAPLVARLKKEGSR